MLPSSESRPDTIVAGQNAAVGLESERYGAVVGMPEIRAGLHLEMKVGQGRVTGVSDQGQRIALLDPVLCQNSAFLK